MDQYVPRIDDNIYLKFYEAIKKRYRGEVHNKLIRENKKTTTGQQQKLKTKITQETISEECKHSGQAQLNHPRPAKT